ncbi:MAG: GTPase HflX [Candidatus Omnitrophica bacterium]|nr:GTPase HflX [Candidatus Omnitrophota bacterium]MCM8793150.1 GTPase HflX [Candidatus Omnitrophota bacterium]
MERAILVITHLKPERKVWDIAEDSQELEELTLSSGGEVLEKIPVEIKRPNPAYFIGRGKAEEIAAIAQEKKAEVVIFNDNLSSTQQRNLEEIIHIKTIDRAQLILDIFAHHARSREGKIQVELAQLEYLLPRLVGKGIMLSRLGGGIGTRGPGEQKLEVDRRKIRKRILKLKRDLELIKSRRDTLRKKRKEWDIPVVAIIGYTNAGKTTLLNTLTSSEELVRDSLFTTLDAVSRRYLLPDKQGILLVDTVGFIHRLPHTLIEAFKSTLEEVKEADLLLHVLDISDPLAYKKKEAVYEVLAELEAVNKPIITALNKIDRIEDKESLERQIMRYENAVAISALYGWGREELMDKIAEVFKSRMVELEIFIPLKEAKLISLIYQEGRVLKEEYLDNGVYLRVKVPSRLREHFFSYQKNFAK